MSFNVIVPWFDPANQQVKEQFPKTQEERENFFIFSPFMNIEDTSLETMILALAAIKIAKMPNG